MSKGKIGAAAAAVVLIAWFFWPAGVGNVRNLDSTGTSIIAFGDSLTAGYGAGEGQDYPSVLSGLAGVTVQNAGVSGDTTESALARLDTDVLSRNPRLVIVGLGGNDFLRRVPVASTEENLRTIVRRIQDSGAMVMLLGFRFPSIGGNYEDMYERVAESERAYLVTGTLKGVLNDPSLKSDEIHPNAKGYALMAERIRGPLIKLLKVER